MTKNPVWFSPKTGLHEIAKKMKQLDFEIAPIGDGKKLLGMVSDRDISLSLADGTDPNKLTGRDIMHKGIVYCFENDDLETVAHDMEAKKVRRLIVLDDDKHKKWLA